ncbi:hypothetical protein MMC07_009671 [Pseudocyphellaria aurata]|nr:hypothetical protein [Pseudocyphellaria aurata]
MKRFISVLLAVQGSFYSAVGKPDVLNFDDISTVRGLGNVPSPYFHLSFSKYNVLTPGDPELKDMITKEDLNCAVSAPNALIGSRYQSEGLKSAKSPEGSYFEIANASSLAEDGLHPYFTLLSFNVKPLAAPAPGTWIIVNGYSHARQDTLTWKVYFDSDYHEPLLVKIQEFSKEEWSQLYGVEILADYGEDALDWEFCLDDLRLQFFEIEEGSVVSRRPWYQQVLKSMWRT